MSKLEKLITAHPICGTPYDKLEFVRFDSRSVPLYAVTGSDDPPTGAFEALGRAFQRYGGKCFYCPTRFRPQALSNELTKAHRDHVVARCHGGSGHLHNLVIACGKCGRDKADDAIHEFRPKAAKQYLDALNKHLAACLATKEG